MIQHDLYGAGGQKAANIATLGMVGGKSQKKDGGKEAMQAPKVRFYVLLPQNDLVQLQSEAKSAGLSWSIDFLIDNQDCICTCCDTACLVM